MCRNASEKLDTVGMNYSENNAESLHKIHPDWKIYGSKHLLQLNQEVFDMNLKNMIIRQI
ncbi:hypothetical protein ONA00_02795 [Mycoplasmopsis cynos]|uniref:hypothetical protein n=1 Tax=Mycoplasmopsis cynos TaxID=171284 RepID=UPI0024C8D383|nr:hypothetical protein [Mycoplasmopsis cynos]WAM11371.1 hypothetical protein ONA00_02795 [Mycoplasmopsis cynos]